MGLNDELTDAEALNIVKEELSKLSTADLIRVASGDTSVLSVAIKNAMTKICVQGAKAEAVTFVQDYWWALLLGGVVLGFGIYYLMK